MSKSSETENIIENHTDFKLSVKSIVLDVKATLNEEKLTSKNLLIFCVKYSWLLVVIIIFIATGTLITLFYRLQIESSGKFGTAPPIPFSHPINQTFQMFFGMMTCFLPLHFLRRIFLERFLNLILGKERKNKKSESEINKNKNNNKNKNKRINPLIFFIPTICLTLASILFATSMLYTYTSVYQMLVSMTVVFTFLNSIIFLGHNFYKFPHKWIGVIFVLIGSFLIGLSMILFPQGKGQATAKSPVFGAFLVVVASFVYSIFLILNEIFLKGYDTSPLEVLGYEGFWGFVICMFILFICYFIPGSDFGSLESFTAALAQCFSNFRLGMWVILVIIDNDFYGISGSIITLNISCATRSVLDQIRASLVWVIQLSRGRQDFTGLQLCGFLVLVSGVLIYNEVGFFMIPCYKKWCNKILNQDKKSGRGSIFFFLWDFFRSSSFYKKNKTENMGK